MINKVIMALMIGLMSVGCVSAGASREPSTTVTLDDVLTFTGEKLAAVGNAVAVTDQKLEAMSTELEAARATISSMENVVGPLDANKDGEISDAEASDFYARVATNPGSQDPVKQSEVYKALLKLLAIQFTTRKLGHKLPPKLQWITAFFGTPNKPTPKSPG